MSLLQVVFNFDSLSLRNVLDFVLNLQLPTQDQLRTVLDKVKDWFGEAKESFGKLTTLNTTPTEEAEGTATEKSK